MQAVRVSIPSCPTVVAHIFNSLLGHECLRKWMTESGLTCPMCRAAISFSNPELELGLKVLPLGSIVSELGSRGEKVFSDLHRQSLGCCRRNLPEVIAVTLLVSRTLPQTFIFGLCFLLTLRFLYRVVMMSGDFLADLLDRTWVQRHPSWDRG